jgi:hypothetical protein
MEITKAHENYPFSTVVLSKLVSFSIYGLGFFIIFGLGWVFASLFLLYVLFFEFRLIKNHCTSCYYWGKTCGFGKGRISSWFFKKGDVSKFCGKEMSWKDIVPDMLISIVPLVVGIILLFIKFDFLVLIALVLLVLFTTAGNSYIRGTLACKYCKQRELGCPAEALFNKGNKHNPSK